jgi:hypothetical protein
LRISVIVLSSWLSLVLAGALVGNSNTGQRDLDGSRDRRSLGAGRRVISEAIAEGAVTVDGDPDAAAALFAAFEQRATSEPVSS